MDSGRKASVPTLLIARRLSVPPATEVLRSSITIKRSTSVFEMHDHRNDTKVENLKEDNSKTTDESILQVAHTEIVDFQTLANMTENELVVENKDHTIPLEEIQSITAVDQEKKKDEENEHISTHSSNTQNTTNIISRSRTYSIYESQWKFNNLLPEMISTILSFLRYFPDNPKNYKYLAKPKTYFVPLDETIQNLRLSCRNWNETILLDHNSQLREYYWHNKKNFELDFTQHFPSNVKMPKLEMPSVNSDARNIFTEWLPSLKANKKSMETFYVKNMERRRIKRNMTQWFHMSEYYRWMVVATMVYLCLMVFFAMLFVQDVFISIFGSIVTDTFIRYFYNLIFIPLYLVLVIFLFVVLLLNVVDAFQDYRSCKDAAKFGFLSLGGTSVFCGLVASTVFMIQLNIGILPLYTTPSQFGRTEMIPWPFVFIPWYILLTCFSLLFGGFSLFFFVDNTRRRKWRYNDAYTFSVFLFMFIQSCLCLLLVIWISIALEFPSVIDSVYLFIPAYIMEFILFVYIFLNILMEVKQVSEIDWKTCGWQRTLCLFGLVFGMALNHIICSLSWYHWIPLAVAYIEVMFPLTCFYAWTMMMLCSHRTPYSSFKTYFKPARNYSVELNDGTWINHLKQKGYW